MSRLRGQRDAIIAAREAREKDNGGEDFIALDGKVRWECRAVAGRGMDLRMLCPSRVMVARLSREADAVARRSTWFFP